MAASGQSERGKSFQWQEMAPADAEAYGKQNNGSVTMEASGYDRGLAGLLRLRPASPAPTAKFRRAGMDTGKHAFLTNKSVLRSPSCKT